MKRLKQAKLYGAELVQVSGTLVGRYNQALAMMGFDPTTLKSFSIDGMGWSPEVAEEKKDLFYLSHSLANPFAIIVTPEQKGKPVYFPYHSFDRSLMDDIFQVNEKQIAALTKQHSICVDIDQSIDAYYDPIDLLEYKSVHTAFHISGGLESAKKEQLRLVDKFYKDDNYLDVDVHNKVLASVRRHGDLREENVALKKVRHNVGSFYTKAFDGIFVIRTAQKHTIIIAEKEAIVKELKNKGGIIVFHIHEPGLIQALLDLKFLNLNFTHISKTRVKRLFESTFVKGVSQDKIEHSITEIIDSTPLYKRYVNSVDKKHMQEHIEFSQLLKNIERKKFDVDIPTSYAQALCQPHHKLKDSSKDLMWQLLGKISQWDAFNLYKYDKEEFYKAYLNWKEPQKEWAIESILKNNQAIKTK